MFRFCICVGFLHRCYGGCDELDVVGVKVKVNVVLDVKVQIVFQQ